MPYVEALGSYGAQRPSALEGLPDALASGMKLGLEGQKNKILLEIARNKNATAEDIQDKKGDVTTQVADMNVKNRAKIAAAKIQSKQESEHVKQTWMTLKQLGQMKDKDPNGYALLMQTHHGKEIVKHIKSTIPDAIDEKGMPIVPSTIDQAKEQLEQIKAQYIEAVKSGKPVDPHLEAAYKAISAHGTDDIAIAAGILHGSGADLSTPEGKDQFKATLKEIKDARGGALDSKFGSGSKADPMGILN